MNRLDVPIDKGAGAPLVLLHGFAMRPATYGRLADLTATRCRVVVPDLFDVPGQWRYAKVLDSLTAAVDHLGLEQFSLLGHSFGGGIALGFAQRYPDRVVELVLSDSLAASREWQLAAEVLHHPVRLGTAGHTHGDVSLRPHVDRSSPPAGRRRLVGIHQWAHDRQRGGGP